MAARNIDVELTINRSPEVTLSTRKKTAKKGDTIKWKKKDNNDKFKITGLEPSGAGTAFENPSAGRNGKTYSCTYTPTSSDPSAEFEYTLTVTADAGGTTHDTTDRPNAFDNGKPVIRN